MKYLRAALCFFLVLFLCSCSGKTVEEMLQAPSLTDDQSKIISALSSADEEKVSLRYPRYGSEREPIQFADLDGDGEDEAVVLFTSSSSGVYVNLAVLDKDLSGEWRLSSVSEGSGTEVESISLLNLERIDRTFILVEWSSSLTSDHKLSVYHYSDGNISIGFEDSCLRILISDIDSDDCVEFCYITEQNSQNRFKVKYVDDDSGTLSVSGEHDLQPAMLDILSFTVGELSDGVPAVFIDEDIGDDEYTTEVFCLIDGKLQTLKSAGGYTISELMTRSLPLTSKSGLYGYSAVAIPSSTPFSESVNLPDPWNYWYKVGADSVEFLAAAYVNETYAFALRLPGGWLDHSIVSAPDDDPRRFVVSDSETGEVRFQLHVLSVGEDDSMILSEGFAQFTASGSYRYYMLFNCPVADKAFIKDNFLIV